MRKFWLVLVIVVLLFTVGASGCSLAYSIEYSADENIVFGVSKRDAFMIEFNWDGDETKTTFVIPDEFNGVPVTRLGGYTGRGFPCPFHINLPDKYSNDSICSLSEDFFEDEQQVAAWFPNGYEIIELQFTVRLGKNVKDLYYHTKFHYYQFTTDGEKTKLYLPKYSFECPEENPYFYAVDGVLYERNTDKPAEWNY